MVKTRIGIIGYGNLGRGVEYALQQQADMELVAIFSRRGKSGVKPLDPTVTIEPIERVEAYKNQIDVMILCGGSATDLPQQTPTFTKWFNTIDSFDTHARIPEHFAATDRVATENKTVSIISVGWDPGLFSLNRAMAEAILPTGTTYTFWGKGLSQGHSDAIRRIEGVKNAVQYTIPIESAIESVRQGAAPVLSTRQKHRRECFVVSYEGANNEKIKQTIQTMPHYFDEYDTTVHFISEEEFHAQHQAMPHGGTVLRSGKTGDQHTEVYEFKLTLDSNPEFTAHTLVAYARAAHRLANEGITGAKTVFDIPIGYLSPLTAEQLRKQLL